MIHPIPRGMYEPAKPNRFYFDFDAMAVLHADIYRPGEYRKLMPFAELIRTLHYYGTARVRSKLAEFVDTPLLGGDSEYFIVLDSETTQVKNWEEFISFATLLEE